MPEGHARNGLARVAPALPPLDQLVLDFHGSREPQGGPHGRHGVAGGAPTLDADLRPPVLGRRVRGDQLGGNVPIHAHCGLHEQFQAAQAGYRESAPLATRQTDRAGRNRGPQWRASGHQTGRPRQFVTIEPAHRDIANDQVRPLSGHCLAEVADRKAVAVHTPGHVGQNAARSWPPAHP